MESVIGLSYSRTLQGNLSMVAMALYRDVLRLVFFFSSRRRHTRLQTGVQTCALPISPAAARETLTEDDRHLERVMLELRLVDGLPVDLLTEPARLEARAAAAEGLLEPAADRWVLTRDRKSVV